MAGLHRSYMYGQRRPQTSPCRNASLPKTGGVHASAPFRKCDSLAPFEAISTNQDDSRQREHLLRQEIHPSEPY
eukprot:5113077-Prymnesium_polylepis.2